MDIENSARGVAIFNAGYAIIILLTSLMYRHALGKSEMLGLSENEQQLTKRTMLHVISCSLSYPYGISP